MVKQIIWTQSAQQNRIAILQYWQRHNQSNAYSKKLNLLFRKAISLIALHPKIGHVSNMEGVRIKPVKNYIIFLNEDDLHIYILLIWDNGTDPETINIRT